MAVHHVLSGKLAITVVELHALLQLEAPRPAVLGHLPARGQPGLIHTRLGVDRKEPLKHRVVLDHVVRSSDDPGTPVVPILLDQPHHQAVHFGFPGCRLALRLGACQHQKQQCRYHEKHHCELPEPRTYHEPTSIAEQRPCFFPLPPHLVPPLPTYLQALSCVHALISQVWPMSPPSQPENGQSSMILGSTITSMYT